MSKKINIILIILIVGLVVFGFYKNKVDEKKEKLKVLEARPEKSLTIIEGWNLKDVSTYLKSQSFSFASDINKARAGDYVAKYDFLDSAGVNSSLEGYLFPDTYRVFASTTLDEVVTKMLNNFSNKITPEMRADIKKQGRSLHEILTMAGIIEKEVKSEADMKIVSGIFWDRIKNGQALESCATLAYILGENKPQYTYEDTRIKSPYNTYINRGLPPGPISNPGLKAIRAAIYPTYTKYNYFLSRPDNGATVFSATYDEHIINKQKYLK